MNATNVNQNSLGCPVSPSIYFPTLEYCQRAYEDYQRGDNSTGAYSKLVHQGGQWSGKTVNILIAFATLADMIPNKLFTVTSVTSSHLAGGAHQDFMDFVYPYFKYNIKQRNKTEKKFIFNSGSVIEFKSFADDTRALGAKRDFLFINEANLFNELLYFQLESRTRVLTVIDYNPAAKFWAHDKLIGNYGCKVLYSDHRHNPFLPHSQHAKTENIEDPELWKVYARGMTGNVTGIIYPNWRRIPDRQFEQEVKDMPYMYGLDFGYTDPTALVKVYYSGNLRYIQELAYTPDLSPMEIKQALIASGWEEYSNVYCDHNNKQAVALLRRYGISNAITAIKGNFSINLGIQHINKEYRVFYNESSVNLHKERERYIWLKDKKTGEDTNTPIDDFNHLLDAARYAIYSHAAPRAGR